MNDSLGSETPEQLGIALLEFTNTHLGLFLEYIMIGSGLSQLSL